MSSTSPDLLGEELALGVESAASVAPGGGAGRDFAGYLATKVLAALISLVAVVVIAFILFSIIPSNPVRTLTQGRPVSAEELATLRRQLGIGEPIYTQFWHFLDNLLHLRLGYSYQFRESVSSLIGQRIGPTMLLMGTSTLISIVLGLWLGIRSGWNEGSRFDKIASGAALALWSVPTFWLGIILLVVAERRVRRLSRDLPGRRDAFSDGRPGRAQHRARRRMASGAALPHARAGRVRAVRDDHALVDHR